MDAALAVPDAQRLGDLEKEAEAVLTGWKAAPW
jgi:hypothetical protein